MKDPYPEFSTQKDLFDRRGVKLVLFVLIPGMIFALVSAAIRVSEYGIDHTILVFGDRTWVANHPAAIRISLMADDGRFFLPEKITAFLKQKARRHLVYNDAVGDRGDAVAVNMEVPELTPGEYVLELDIRFDERRRTIEIPVRVVDEPPEESLEIPQDSREKKHIDRLSLGEQVARLFTEDRGAPTGITSTAFLRIEDADGTPVERTVDYTISDKSMSKETDRLGLLAMSLDVGGLSLPVRVAGATQKGAPRGDAGVEDAGVAETGASFYPNVVYSGLSLSIHTPIAPLESRIKVTLEQVSSGGPVYANLFHDGRFVQGSSGFLSGRNAVMEIRPETPGLYRLQVATAAIGVGDGVAVRHFYVSGPDEEPVDGLRNILARIRNREPRSLEESIGHLEAGDADKAWAAAVLGMDLRRGGFDVQKAAAFALSRLYNGHRHPAQLISSRLEDDKELTAFKTKFQRMMMVAIIALGLGVCCFIGLFALAAHKRQQRISLMIMEADADDGGDEADDWSDWTGYKSTGRVLIQGAILFFIVLGAFVAIALLVDTLTWRA